MRPRPKTQNDSNFRYFHEAQNVPSLQNHTRPQGPTPYSASTQEPKAIQAQVGFPRRHLARARRGTTCACRIVCVMGRLCMGRMQECDPRIAQICASLAAREHHRLRQNLSSNKDPASEHHRHQAESAPDSKDAASEHHRPLARKLSGNKDAASERGRHQPQAFLGPVASHASARNLPEAMSSQRASSDDASGASFLRVGTGLGSSIEERLGDAAKAWGCPKDVEFAILGFLGTSTLRG